MSSQVCIPRTIRFSLWIDMQDYSCNFSPVGPLALGLQKARVSHDMLLVIDRQRLLVRRSVRHVRIEWWIFHQIRFEKAMKVRHSLAAN